MIYPRFLKDGRTALQIAKERGHVEVVELLQSQPDPEGDVEEVKVKGYNTQQQQAKGDGDNNMKEVQVGSQKSDTSPALAKKENQEGGAQKGLRKFLPSWPWTKNKLVRIIVIS